MSRDRNLIGVGWIPPGVVHFEKWDRQLVYIYIPFYSGEVISPLGLVLGEVISPLGFVLRKGRLSINQNRK